MESMSLKGIVVATAIGAVIAAPAPATLVDSEASANTAIDLCHRAEKSPDRAAELLDRGLRMAETAVAADESDARARLAVFCNLGKQIEYEGLGFGTMSKVRRLRREIDLAHQLAPNDPDILAAKGAMLVELPRMFGGDVRQGESLLRRSLAIRGGNASALRYLAMAIEAQDSAGMDEGTESDAQPNRMVRLAR